MLLETNKSRVLRDKEFLEKYIKENNVEMIEKMKAKLEVVKWLQGDESTDMTKTGVCLYPINTVFLLIDFIDR